MTAPATGRIRLYPRHDQSRPAHLVRSLVCGHCHAPLIPHGSLAFYDTHLAIETEGDGCFVLIRDPDQPECDGLTTKYLRRTGDGSLELRSNVGRKKLTPRHQVVGTLVMLYLPDRDGTGELDVELRAMADHAMTREKARQAQTFADAAASRWGKPNTGG